MKIGFIGTGVMGSAMIGHLMNAGFEVNIYTRTKSKAEELLKNGAIWQDTPKKVAENSDVVITIVGYPSDVEEVYFGKDSIIEGIKAGSIVVDMTTSTPTLAKKIYEEFKKIGYKIVLHDFVWQLRSDKFE